MEVLHKAITKAVDGGWDMFGHAKEPIFRWRALDGDNHNRAVLACDYGQNGLMYENHRAYRLNEIIFNRDFAAAIAGTEKDEYLHEMALAKDRLKELESWL